MTVELKQQTVVVATIDQMKKVTSALHGQTLGLVPTMGYLHDGHMRLVKQSIKTCSYTIVSGVGCAMCWLRWKRVNGM